MEELGELELEGPREDEGARYLAAHYREALDGVAGRWRDTRR